MSDKVFCPFYNVGFCKYKDKCSKEHAERDCPDQTCRSKNCSNRRRRLCKFGPRCTYLKRKTCEVKHHDGETVMETELTEVRNEAKLHLDTSDKLNKEIQAL